MDSDGLKAHDDTYFAQGYHLKVLESHAGPYDWSGEQYLAVWRAAAGEQHWAVGMSEDEMKDRDNDLFQNGQRIVQLAAYVDASGGYNFGAVWRPGTGAQHWGPGMDVGDFKTRDEDFFKKGFRLADAAVANGYVIPVWRPGTGAQIWEARDDENIDDFAAVGKKHFANGFRLQILAWG